MGEHACPAARPRPSAGRPSRSAAWPATAYRCVRMNVARSKRAVRGAQEQRPALVEAGDRLAGQVVVGQQPAAVRCAVQRGAEQGLEDRRRCRRRRPARAANSANRPAQASSSLAPLLQCTIATRSPAGVVTRSSSWCTRLELALEHDHREDAGAGADVAGARRDRVGGDHPGAGVALGRAQRERRRRSVPVGSSSRGPGVGERAGRLPGAARSSGSRSASGQRRPRPRRPGSSNLASMAAS